MTRRRGCAVGDSEFLAELGRPIPSPDLTRAIMRRLALGECSKQARRRRRVRLLVSRVSICAAALVAVGIGVRLHEASLEARLTGPSIPAAIQHDLRRHGDTIDRAIRAIRGWAPEWPEPLAAPEMPQVGTSSRAGRGGRFVSGEDGPPASGPPLDRGVRDDDAPGPEPNAKPFPWV